MVASSLPSKASRQAATTNSAASQIAKITEYETQLTSAAKKTEFNPNPLIPLTALARHDSPEVVHKAVWALYRAWVKILSDGHLVPTAAGGQGDAGRTKNGSGDESPEAAAAAVQKWMMDRLNEYLEVLAGLLRDSEPSLRVSLILYVCPIQLMHHRGIISEIRRYPIFLSPTTYLGIPLKSSWKADHLYASHLPTSPIPDSRNAVIARRKAIQKGVDKLGFHQRPLASRRGQPVSLQGRSRDAIVAV